MGIAVVIKKPRSEASKHAVLWYDFGIKHACYRFLLAEIFFYLLLLITLVSARLLSVIVIVFESNIPLMNLLFECLFYAAGVVWPILFCVVLIFRFDAVYWLFLSYLLTFNDLVRWDLQQKDQVKFDFALSMCKFILFWKWDLFNSHFNPHFFCLHWENETVFMFNSWLLLLFFPVELRQFGPPQKIRRERKKEFLSPTLIFLEKYWPDKWLQVSIGGYDGIA